MRLIHIIALMVLMLPLFQVGPKIPREYTCHRTSEEMVIDGALNEDSWRNAAASEPFVDIEGNVKPTPRMSTRVRILWDERYLYIGAEMEEPHVWATLTKRDSVIFHDNDFEVFIDPDGDREEYYELEINALNTVWDLFLNKTYRNGGKARHDWDIAGLKTAVHVSGTLNDPSDLDTGWSVEIAIPWRALAEYAHKPAPPLEGDVWRINFSRVQWRHEITAGRYVKIPKIREDNWVWSPQGAIDMHLPEMWGRVRFSEKAVGTKGEK